MNSPTPQSPTTQSPRIVVIGAGMAAHRLVDSLVTRAEERISVTVLGDESRLPYDRVGLTRYFDGEGEDALTLPATKPVGTHAVEVRDGDLWLTVQDDA